MSDFDPPEEPDRPLPLPVQEKKLGYLMVAFLVGLLCAIPAYLIAYSRGYTKVQSEAVRSGHAVYRVTDEFGRTKFEWIPEKK